MTIDHISITVWKVKSQLLIPATGGKSISSETTMVAEWIGYNKHRNKTEKKSRKYTDEFKQ